jgi:hypothetical protein
VILRCLVYFSWQVTPLVSGRRRGPPVRGAGYEPVTGNNWQSQETSTTRIRCTQRVRKSKGSPSNTAANTSTYDDDVLSQSPCDSPRGHKACRGPLADTVDNACRASGASHETTRLSASAAVKCLSQSSESTRTPTEPRHLSATHSQYTATDGPGEGPSKQPPTSSTSHDGRASNRTGSSLRESSTGHRHATHRCHTILQIHRQPRPLRPPKIGEGLVTLHRMTKPEEIRVRALMLSNSKPCRSAHRPHTPGRRRRHQSCCGRRKTLANT